MYSEAPEYREAVKTILGFIKEGRVVEHELALWYGPDTDEWFTLDDVLIDGDLERALSLLILDGIVIDDPPIPNKAGNYRTRMVIRQNDE